MRVGSIQFRMLGVVIIGTICSLIACSGGSGTAASGTQPNPPSLIAPIINAPYGEDEDEDSGSKGEEDNFGVDDQEGEQEMMENDLGFDDGSEANRKEEERKKKRTTTWRWFCRKKR